MWVIYWVVRAVWGFVLNPTTWGIGVNELSSGQSCRELFIQDSNSGKQVPMGWLGKAYELTTICLIRSEWKAKLQRNQWLLLLGKKQSLCKETQHGPLAGTQEICVALLTLPLTCCYLWQSTSPCPTPHQSLTLFFSCLFTVVLVWTGLLFLAMCLYCA